MTLPIREGPEADALRTDRYLESLLAAIDRHATDAPADPRLDPAVRDAATRLSRDLVRVHPSFRFEERLAARLAEVAASLRLAQAAGAEGSGPIVAAQIDPELLDPSITDPRADTADDGLPLPRNILIGGAITSAALSLVGAAYIAWRRSRPPLSPMARAVRSARQARLGLRLAGAPRRRLD